MHGRIRQDAAETPLVLECLQKAPTIQQRQNPGWNTAADEHTPGCQHFESQIARFRAENRGK